MIKELTGLPQGVIGFEIADRVRAEGPSATSCCRLSSKLRPAGKSDFSS